MLEKVVCLWYRSLVQFLIYHSLARVMDARASEVTSTAERIDEAKSLNLFFTDYFSLVH